MIPVLFNKNEQQFRTYGLGEITDIINPKVTRERNGQYLLYFQYPQDAEFSDVFEEDMRIKSDAGVRTKWQTFEITRVIREEGKLIEVFAKHISQSLLKDALNPNVNVRSSNAQQALRTWNSNRIGDEEFDVWSDISTISSTSWNIQDVSNAFEALAGVQDSILDVWGGEYEFDNKMIRLHKEMGRKSPVPLEYGRNITGLEQDIQEDNVYTSIYPFATYIPESGSEPKTVTLPERYVDGKYLEMHNKRKIQVVDFSGEFESDDIPTVSRLKTLAKQYIESNEIGMPHENLKVGYLDLSKTLDYQKFKIMEEVELNDRLPIFYPKFGITNENAKVVVINYDPVKEENISIELGVIGQSFRTVTTGGVDSRLDKIEKQQKETVRYIVNNKGNRIWFETPDENMEHKIGDTWFEKNGLYDRIRVWNGNQWETIIDSEDIDKNAKAIAEQQQEIEEAKQTADEAVEQINTAVVNAGFTSLNETISSVQSISNQAQINSGAAINNALEAMQQASQAINNTGSLNVRVDEVENTLSVKADKQMVDVLTGVVDVQGLDIQANAQGLALKANQSTVDTLAGTVSSLGTNFDIVAGQVNSRVWNTDIQTAVDGLKVGGRNLILKSNVFWKGVGATGITSEKLGDGLKVKVTEGSGNWFTGFKNTTDFLIEPEDDGEQFTISFYVHEEAGFTGNPNLYIKAGYTYTQMTRRNSGVGRNVWSLTFRWKNPETRINLHLGLDAVVGTFTINAIKLEKGNKATDWTPAPEDTDAKIRHIETEWTQTFDAFNQTVAGIDGRVTQQKQTIDSISSAVSGHGDRISTVEQTASGLQSTVADKASQSQVTQLANGLSSVVKDLDDLEIGGRNLYLDSGRKITSSAYSIATYNFASKPIAGEKYTLSIKGKINPENHTGFYTNIFDGSEYPMMTIVGPEDLGSDGVYRKTFTMPHLADYISTSLYSYPLGTYVEASVEWIKFEKGNKATDWTPAPEDTQSQISQLANNINLRVTKGELLSQINIEAGRTLIQSDRLLLNATNTVITGTAWMDGAVIANASIDGAKIADATIGSAKISALDVSKLSGNTTEFVRSAWNAGLDNVTIDASGIYMTGSGAWRRTYLTATGFDLYAGENASDKAGAVGYFKPYHTLATASENYIENQVNSGHFIGMVANRGNHVVLGYQPYSTIKNGYERALQVDGDTGRIRVYRPLHPANSSYSIDFAAWDANGIYGAGFNHPNSGMVFSTSGTLIWDESGRHWDRYNMTNRHHIGFFGNSGIRSRYDNSSMEIWSGGGAMFFYTGHSTLMMALRANLDMETGINMKGYRITNQSDRRLKKGITETNLDSLGAVKSWNIVDYEWKHGAGPEGRKIGMIAQDTPELSVINTDSGYYSIDASKQLMMTTHAVQQLAFKHDETNELAGQAYFLAETLADKMERLENRIEELERNVA